MSTKIKKRFIANAVCPQCKLIDKICWYFEEHDERITCVNCGYTELKSETLKQQKTEQKPINKSEQTIQWYSSKPNK